MNEVAAENEKRGL